MLELGFSLGHTLLMISSDLLAFFTRDFVSALWNLKNDLLQ